MPKRIVSRWPERADSCWSAFGSTNQERGHIPSYQPPTRTHLGHQTINQVRLEADIQHGPVPAGVTPISDIEAPICVREPCCGIEDESDIALMGDLQIGLEIAPKALSPHFGRQKWKRSEARQIDAFHEDQEGLESAIRQEHYYKKQAREVPGADLDLTEVRQQL